MKMLFSNIKKIALSLLVVGLAIGTQSFVNYQKVDEGDIYVNLNGDDYTLLDGEEFEPENCSSTNEIQCAYEVTEEGATHVTASFDADDAATYLANEWIEPKGSLGVYDPEQ